MCRRWTGQRLSHDLVSPNSAAKEDDTYFENPLFYATWNDESSTWVQAFSDERTTVSIEICEEIPGTGEPDHFPAI